MKNEETKKYRARNGWLTKRAADVWESARFTNIFLALGFFYISNIVHAHPHAANANRWAFSCRNKYEMKKSVVVQIIAIFLLSSCQFSSLKIINHEKPNIQTDFSPFRNIGCDESHGYENWYRCEEGSPLIENGCNSIENMPLLGGLTPSYPIAACTLEINEWIWVGDIPNDCIYSDGGALTFCHRFIIFKEGKYQVVKTMDDFRELFAPVDSPDEALSFALAFSDYFASYGQTEQDDYVYSVKELEDTFVETDANGYLVHVFYTPSFGCGPFETNAVEIKITYDGNIKEDSRYPVYRDPSKDNMCAD